MLTLPSSFGAIQLGETFSSCLAVSNETGEDISGVQLTVEIQTATTKVLLAEFSTGSDGVLKGGDTLEAIVHHEIKELGQHVLACMVQYTLPPGARRLARTEENDQDPSMQLFRKFYKFAVSQPVATNDLSSLMSRFEGDKSPVGQDKSACPEITLSALIEKRKGEGFSGGSYPKPDSGCVVVPKD